MKLHHYLIILITILSLPAGQVVADEKPRSTHGNCKR